MGLGAQVDLRSLLALPLICCVTTDKLLNLSGPQSSYKMGVDSNKIFLVGL